MTDIIDRLKAFRGPRLGDGINDNVGAIEIIDEIERLRGLVAHWQKRYDAVRDQLETCEQRLYRE